MDSRQRMTVRAFATILDDREGVLLAKLGEVFPRVARLFDAVAVVATEATDPRVLTLLRDLGAGVATRPNDVNTAGRSRREAVGIAIERARGSHILYADLDHVLRWIESDSGEFDGVLQRAAGSDCLIIGRGPRSMAALPRRLAATEGIVNEIYALITGRRWDLMMAARGLSES
jgi:hypothetical protein